MNAVMLARLLGWFSLGLGAAEVVAPAALSRRLGLGSGPWLVRAFGLREIAAGLTVLAKPESTLGPVARVGGDILDIAALVPALAPSNRNKGAAQVALALVLGITALDLVCVSALASGNRQRERTARRTHVKPGQRALSA